MKFVSRYLFMNINLNKKTISFTYFKRIYSSAGCTSRLSAQTHSLLTTVRASEQIYRCTGVKVYM